MPGSISSAGSSNSRRLDTGSFVHYGSSIHSHHSRRSPSPTEHYRNQQANSSRLEDKLFELNKFIYKGIDQFLDKQAVRDLITSFDEDDIYPEGGLDGDLFLRSDSTETNDFGEEMLTIVQENNKTVQIQQETINRHKKHFEKTQKENLLLTFMSIIRFKVFNVQRNVKRSDVDTSIFQDEDKAVSCFC